MARLVGFIGNRPDLCTRFAEHEREILSDSRAADAPWGWGVGFFQSGEILLKRRPLDDRTTISIDAMMDDVRSDILIAQVRRGHVGTHRTANTQPFRYRQWLFANTGDIGGFEAVRTRLLETLPRFLQRSLRGDTDSELLFHLFLSFLHDAGKLDHPVVTPEDVFPALKSSLALLDRMGREAAAEPSKVNILLATPEYLIAVHRGEPMAYRMLTGREAFEPMFAYSGPSKLRMPDLEPCRLAVVASDFGGEPPADWTVVPKQAMVAFTRTAEPTIIEAR